MEATTKVLQVAAYEFEVEIAKLYMEDLIWRTELQ